MISERDNNRNADDADLADCRGFAERDARRGNNGNADDADLADCRGFAGRDARRGSKGERRGVFPDAGFANCRSERNYASCSGNEALTRCTNSIGTPSKDTTSASDAFGNRKRY